jgi:putative ABC transport system permease protein
MRIADRIGIWLRSIAGRSRMENEMSEELRFHVEAYANDLEKRGVSREEAYRRARVEFGSVERSKEECREARGLGFVDTAAQDLRYAVRMFRKNLGFTAVAVLTLGLGIGATTAIFSIVNAVLLKPLAMHEPSRVMLIREDWRGDLQSVSVGNFIDAKRQSGAFATVGASKNASFNLAGNETPERVQGEITTADYFTVFGVQPIAGRVFGSEEDKPGRGKVVVISERMWRTRLHADTGVVGQPLRINGLPYTVVGIMPKMFDPILSESELWIPAAFTDAQLAEHDDHYLDVVGRLKNGVTLGQAQSELNVIATRLQEQFPMDDAERGLNVTPLASALLGDQKVTMRMMLAAVGLLLLIACANIANLQLARSRTRQKEIAVRVAIGASPQRIVRQLLAENIVLGLAGGVVGVCLAALGVSWVVAHGPTDVPRLSEAGMDGTTLVFACAIALCSSLLFGLAPAMRSASIRINEVFKESTGTSSGARDRVRSFLVVGELALALILMTGAGLLIRSALLVSHQDAGFDTSNLMVGRVGLPDAGYREPAVARATFERMIEAAVALPGARSAAMVSRAPMTGGGSTNGLIPEGKALEPANAINSQLQIVSPSYLTTARIPLVAGRDFAPQDTRETRMVTIVNETLARTMWPGESAIGKRFACCEAGPKGQQDPVWHEIVGVAKDVRAWGLDRAVGPEFYLPVAQMPADSWDWIGRTMDVMVRSDGNAVSVRELQSTIASIAPGVPMYRVSSMQQKISDTLERSHFDTFLLALFAGAALLLSSVGIYGVLSYTVAQRTRDIGIRMALGATQLNVMKNVLGYGARLAIVGVIIGIAGGLAGTRLLSSLLYGVQATDLVTFATAAAVLLGVAMVASYVPARRATLVDPMRALRDE